MIIDSVEENLKFKHMCVMNLDNIEFDIPIYRVYPIDRLLQLFNEKKNTLVKPLMWDDPFENLIFQQTARTNAGHPVNFDDLRECLYGQCWTLNLDETDALWRIYSPNKNGIRVKTTLRKLWDNFYDPQYKWAMISYFIGKIYYGTELEIKNHFEDPENLIEIFGTNARGIINTVLIKRKAFEHENEVRLVFRANKEEFDLVKNVYQYNFDPVEILDELLFDPRFDNNLFSIIKDELEKIGFDKPIEKSNLYQPPNFDLTFKI